jgi:hypothetical protein
MISLLMLSRKGATVYCEGRMGKKQDRGWRLGHGLDVCSSNPNRDKRLSFLENKILDLLWGLLNRYRGSLNGVKRLGPECNLSPVTSPEIKNQWSYTSTPLYSIMESTGQTCVAL